MTDEQKSAERAEDRRSELNVLLSEHFDIVCSKYEISSDERDSVLMSIRKFIEDCPGESIEIRKISENSGVGTVKTKALMYTMLYTGSLVCDPVKADRVIHFHGRNSDGSPATR